MLFIFIFVFALVGGGIAQLVLRNSTDTGRMALAFGAGFVAAAILSVVATNLIFGQFAIAWGGIIGAIIGPLGICVAAWRRRSQAAKSQT